MKAFQMNFIEISQSLLSRFYDKIMDIEPKDGGGMWLWPESDDPNQLIEELAPLLEEAQWFVSSNKDRMFFIEPLVTKPVRWQSVTFHVSEARNRDSIDQNGLEAREGGNTAMERSYAMRHDRESSAILAFRIYGNVTYVNTFRITCDSDGGFCRRFPRFCLDCLNFYRHSFIQSDCVLF